MLIFLSLLSSLISAGAESASSSRSSPAPVVYQPPVTLELENIAVRASSQLLITSVVSPTLHTFDPTAINGKFDAVHTFPNVTGLTGIVEYRPDVFALLASRLNSTTGNMAPGSISAWSVDFNAPTPLVREIGPLADTPNANGLTALPTAPDILLFSDSTLGAVWQLDARTGASRIAIQDPSMLPSAAPVVGINAGINGLHVRLEAQTPYLYFTNTHLATFSRVALEFKRGNVSAAGPIQTLATIPQPPAIQQQDPDDFALDERGRAWVTVHPGAITVFSPPAHETTGNWSQTTVLGDVNGTDAQLFQPTSAAFGRGSLVQSKTLYVVTAGSQVVAIDTTD
ncbi:hypothetical protein B0H16DRAFT_1804872 [Mycena metata]|uniref:SMP-30/Gluconolactonase/LRE-like region domain-containing protein n=1 Tax=Mycena metata TaxID=1033252 RepID=A0AAD7H9R2_9AGAR|nr:hypothetical protein B0H16DRAFT_1804872 [Mycena metata]